MIKIREEALAGVAQWFGCHSANQKVVGSILVRTRASAAGQAHNQLMCLSCIDASLPLFFPICPSL